MAEDKYFHQNPVRWKIIGDTFDALPYRGEATKLLWQLKNSMKFNDIKQYGMKRYFQDGTVIIARSIFGQDFLEIIAPEELEKKIPFCSITLLNVPEVIPPMKWYTKGTETFEKVDGEWVIKNPEGELEVEGVDYIKTYYRINVIDCPGCSSLDFTVGKEMGVIKASTPYRPFWYKSERDDGSLIYTYQDAIVPHYMGYTTALGIVIPENPLNHMIYSLWASGQAEIIKAGADEGGSYILWRAYTEWSNVGPHVVDFSGTGLGYMLMQAFIKNEGISLCESDGVIIKVDCCLKPVEERDVILYWESISNFFACGPTCGGQPFMFYGSIKICEVPDVVSTSLYYMLCTPRCIQTFYTIPGIKGGCLPFTWELSGYAGLTLTPSQAFGEYAGLAYECSLGSPHCQSGASITVTDRCGARDTFRFLSCCENAVELAIGYTSLVMGCGAKQTLTAGGGCGPYSWSIGGGGSLNITVGQEVIYTAPETNPNCTQNPTITLTDCCGGSAELKLAVNCYTAALALRNCQINVCESCHFESPKGCYCRAVTGRWDYDCNGTLTSTLFNEPYEVGGFSCSYSTTLWGCGDYQYAGCPGINNCYGIGNEFSCCNNLCETRCTPSCASPDVCGLNDRRTTAMKDAGCCPINPLTGLPF